MVALSDLPHGRFLGPRCAKEMSATAGSRCAPAIQIFPATLETLSHTWNNGWPIDFISVSLSFPSCSRRTEFRNADGPAQRQSRISDVSLNKLLSYRPMSELNHPWRGDSVHNHEMSAFTRKMK